MINATPRSFAPGKGTTYPFYRRLAGSHSTVGNRVKEGIHNFILPKIRGMFLNMYCKTRSYLKNAVLFVPKTHLGTFHIIFLAIALH